MIVKTVPHEENPEKTWLVYFKHKGASANIAIPLDDRSHAHLYDMRSTNRRKGEGTELLREIDEYCHKHELTLLIRAKIFDVDVGDDAIQSNEELRAWYEKNGAVFIMDDRREGPLLAFGYLD